MSLGVKRFQQTRQTHFVTFSCYHRQQKFESSSLKDLFPKLLEQTRRRYNLSVYAFVVMPEHVHLLLSEPERGLLANAIQSLKIAVAVRAREVLGNKGPFWQRRYHDHNVRDYEGFAGKLRYIHRNPVQRGLCANPEDWTWSSFRHYASGEELGVEIESKWLARSRELNSQT